MAVPPYHPFPFLLIPSPSYLGVSSRSDSRPGSMSDLKGSLSAGEPMGANSSAQDRSEEEDRWEACERFSSSPTPCWLS